MLNIMVQVCIKYVLFCLIAFLTVCLRAQGPKTLSKLTLFDRLETESQLKIELSIQVDSLIIMKLRPFVSKGSMNFEFEDAEFELPVKVSVRGKYRRRTCDFPPLLLDFPKDELKDQGFKKSDEYKLVTHCLSNKEAQNYLFREHLIYEMYRELDSLAYRSIVFPIKYIDTDTRQVTRSYGMLLESNDELKDRLDGKWCDCMGLDAELINDYYRELVIFFQYMIGNKDINMQIEHNVRFLEGKKYDKKIPIPYDFDFSAFVRAPYVFSDQSVTYDRSPLIMGKNAVEFDKVLTLFKLRKQRFFQIINEFKLLSKRHKKRCLKFMEDFYKLIEKPNFKQKYFR
ncbi:MAG: hypothetical protein IPL46_08945 [Saprospiraceae bacterium]|nr:hypothetical protein [Saprospiraceae bacterium]